MENLGNPVTILQNMDQAVNLAYATSRYFQKTWATLNPWKSELFELSQIFIENIATQNPWKSLLSKSDPNYWEYTVVYFEPG